MNVEKLTLDELIARRGELAYAAQMAALESLPLAEETTQEMREVARELERRGVDLNGD